MPFSILEPRESTGSLSGTVFIRDDQGADQFTLDSLANRKRGQGKDSNTLLVPQPSDDVRDPLNWPQHRKDLVYLVLLANSVICAAVPGIQIVPSLFELSIELQQPVAKVSQLTGYQFLVTGVIGPFVSASARIYGKRPQFLFASLAGLVGTIICASSQTSFNTLFAGRLVQGIGAAAYESLFLSSIGEIYFVHDRGFRTGMATLVLTSVAPVVSIIAGVINRSFGWHYLFYVYVPFLAAGLISVFLLVPETQFNRPVTAVTQARQIGLHTHQDVDQGDKESADHVEKAGDIPNAELKIAASTEPSSAESQAPESRYFRQLAVFSGRYTDMNPVYLVAAPILTVLNPAVIWAFLTGCGLVGLQVGTGYIYSDIWSRQPYSLNTDQNGYFYVGAVIGGSLGAIGGSKLSDWCSSAMTARNGGKREAEFRLPPIIISVVFFGIGFFVLFWVVEHPFAEGWYLGAFCHGCNAFALSTALSVSSLYILDSFPVRSTEIFMLLMLGKNVLSFAFSLFMNDWLAKDGPGIIFIVYGAAALAMCATTAPMYVLGKWNRAFVQRQLWREADTQ